MTKRQTNTITALVVTLIVTQVLCTAALLRRQDRIRSEAKAAEIAFHRYMIALDTHRETEMKRDLEIRQRNMPVVKFSESPFRTAAGVDEYRLEADVTRAEAERERAKIAEQRARMVQVDADLERQNLMLGNRQDAVNLGPRKR